MHRGSYYNSLYITDTLAMLLKLSLFLLQLFYLNLF